MKTKKIVNILLLVVYIISINASGYSNSKLAFGNVDIATEKFKKYKIALKSNFANFLQKWNINEKEKKDIKQLSVEEVIEKLKSLNKKEQKYLETAYPKEYEFIIEIYYKEYFRKSKRLVNTTWEELDKDFQSFLLSFGLNNFLEKLKVSEKSLGMLKNILKKVKDNNVAIKNFRLAIDLAINKRIITKNEELKRFLKILEGVKNKDNEIRWGRKARYPLVVIKIINKSKKINSFLKVLEGMKNKDSAIIWLLKVVDFLIERKIITNIEEFNIFLKILEDIKNKENAVISLGKATFSLVKRKIITKNEEFNSFLKICCFS
jgi:PII-like signaling protein